MRDLFSDIASTVVAGAVVAGAVTAVARSRPSNESSADDEESPGDEPSPTVAQNREMSKIQRTGMMTLLGWSVANIGVGSVGWATSDGRSRYFHQMNVFWNGVNAAIATAGYIGAANDQPTERDALETVDRARSTQQMLLFNAGLDLAYVAGGAWLRQRGRSRDDARSMGSGESVILQGAFLFAFDAVFWAVLERSVSDFQTSIRTGANEEPVPLIQGEC